MIVGNEDWEAVSRTALVKPGETPAVSVVSGKLEQYRVAFGLARRRAQARNPGRAKVAVLCLDLN